MGTRRSAIWSADGRWLLLVPESFYQPAPPADQGPNPTADHRPRLIDIASRREIARLNPGSFRSAYLFSPDGRYLAHAEGDYLSLSVTLRRLPPDSGDVVLT